MKYVFILLFYLLCESAPAQQGYTILEGNPIWISENYQSQQMQPFGSITDAGEVFEANSGFSANPDDNNSDYRFDYQITSHVVTPFFNGEVTYYVNSADNSIAIAFDNQSNHDLLRVLSAKYPDYSRLHFIIRKANGNMLACGLYENPKTGRLEKRAVDLGKDLPINDLIAERIWLQMQWFNDARRLTSEQIGATGASPQVMEIIEHVPIEGYRGKVSPGQTIDMYFVKFPVTEPITPLFMGLGNGIIKNLKNKTNQLVIWMAARNIPWKGSTTSLFFYLQKMYKVNAVFHPGNYIVTTIFNKKGMRDAQQFQAYAMQKYGEIQRIQRLARDCPEGSAGKACRERYEKQIREIQKVLEDKAKDLGEKHHIPVQ